MLETLIRNTKDRADNALHMTQGAMQSQHFISTQSGRIPKTAYLTNNLQASSSVPNQSFVKDSVMSYCDEQYLLGDYTKPTRGSLQLTDPNAFPPGNNDHQHSEP